MLYPLVRPLARIALKVHFRKIYFYNQEAIDPNKPVLLAANHPTAFIEPCVLACFQPEPLHFLVRGDIFKKPFYIWLLNSLHMVPMFRLKDGGYGKLKRNYETMDFCFEKLRENKTIMILAEGSTKHEKRLRPLRKGTARIAFGAIDQYSDLDIQIVPVGVNYTYAERFREDVMIECGSPIRVRDYLPMYETSPAEAMRQLLDDLNTSLEKSIIIIEKPEDELLVEQLFIMSRNDYPAPPEKIVIDTNDQLQRERRIASQVNKMAAAEKQQLKAQAAAYFNELQQKGLSDLAVMDRPKSSQALLLALGAIPFAIGYVLNYPPVALTKFIINRLVTHIEFKMSIALAVGLFSFPVYWLLLFVFLSLLVPYGWLWALLVPLSGSIALHYRDLYLDWKARGGGSSVSQAERQRLRELRDEVKLSAFIEKVQS